MGIVNAGQLGLYQELPVDLRDAVEDRYCALFEEHEHHGWVDSCFAAVSYEHFYRRMVAAARGSAEALVGLVGRHAPLSEEVVSLNGVGE